MEMGYDERVLHELEEELGTKILPGTEVMADVGSHHFVKATDQVLVPQPSADPNDPLNWSRPWKFSVMFWITFLSFAQGLGPLALAPMFPALIEKFDSTLADVVQFTGISILVLGFSNFLWVPLATSIGRRPVALASTLICFGSMIWRAQAQTYSSFMGACILNGIGAGPAETLQPTVITDVMFLHERGVYNTLYFCFYFGSLMIGPIIAGPMSSAVGEANFWWLNVAMHAVVFIGCLVGFPETKWHRQHPIEVAKQAAALTEQKVEPKADSIENHASDPEKSSPTHENGLSKVATASRDPYLGKGKPSKSQFGLWKLGSNPAKDILLDLWIPWKLFAFPIVEFASFVVSWSASCFLTINLTQSQALAAPPYNFSPTSIGLMNFAILIGALIGLATAGPLSDYIAARLTKRNKGIREPEMRLVTMIPYVLIMLLGNFVVAFGFQYHWDWRAIVIIGFTCAGIQVTALPSIASTYAVDSYKPVTGSVFVAITVNKNVWGYGFAKFITPWSEASGFVPPIMTNMSLTFLWCLSGIIFWYYGKKFRSWTRNDKVHTM